MSLTIMFIDDSESDKVLFRHVLQAIDPTLQYITAADGREGLEFLQLTEKLPDYIFLDINMPRMNGMEFLAVIKKMDRLSQIPVILYSTAQAWIYEQMATELGATQCLTKSMDFDETCSTIGSIILNDPAHSNGKQKNGHEQN
jgi:CheY-like chemotaxis protein